MSIFYYFSFLFNCQICFGLLRAEWLLPRNDTLLVVLATSSNIYPRNDAERVGLLSKVVSFRGRQPDESL